MLYTGLKDIRNLDERKRIIEKLMILRKQLDEDIPGKTAENSLLLATWNIRQFDDSRKTESLYYIAEILSRFDLIAVQEVRGNRKGLERVMKILGKNWDYIATDVTEGDKGNNECIAFLYDTNKVSFKNMAGEIVLPDDNLIDSLQFARTPFSVAFQCGWFKFNLSTVHIYYGSKAEELERRRKEIERLAQFLSKRADKEGFNYVVLGDFNIPDVGDRYMEALETNGFYIPEGIKEHPTDLGGTKHYDQIAFNLKSTDNMTLFEEKAHRSGSFDFTKSVYGVDEYQTYIPYMPEYKDKSVTDPETGKKTTVKEKRTDKDYKSYFKTYYRTFQMSDHLPLWVQLNVDFSSQYLDGLHSDVLKKLEK